jgi:hypothetical protein
MAVPGVKAPETIVPRASGPTKTAAAHSYKTSPAQHTCKVEEFSPIDFVSVWILIIH